MGGATICGIIIEREQAISIHAPRGGSDLLETALLDRLQLFQSTLPVGGATLGGNRCPIQVEISIHAPRGGSDHFYHPSIHGGQYFNPRSPWGERPNTAYRREMIDIFQSTLPVGGATINQVGSLC